MSNHLAIATVTAALRHVLQEHMPDDVPAATATSMRPDAAAGGLPATGVNIYLYRASLNANFRNHDLPARAANGTLRQKPLTALNLHYLLSFYGDESLLETQRVMGSVVRILEARPLITAERIHAVLSDPLYAFLGGADLYSQIERISLTPEEISVDDMSKIWSTLLQTIYPLSIGYMASAVLIESRAEVGSPLPVTTRNIHGTPLTPIIIRSVAHGSGRMRPIVFGDAVTIRGAGFTSAITAVTIDSVSLTSFTIRSTDEISVQLTDPALRAGAVAVCFRTSHFQRSNSFAFLLRPAIAIQLAGVTAAALPVAVDPPVGRAQRVRLLLNEYLAPDPNAPRRYQIDAPENNGISDPAIQEIGSITFDISGVSAGTYLVRVDVDGAESAFEQDVATGELISTNRSVTIP